MDVIDICIAYMHLLAYLNSSTEGDDDGRWEGAR